MSQNTFRKYINLNILTRQRIGDFVYLTSQILTPVVGFFTSVIAAKYILPYDLGVIQTVMLVSVYCSFFHFGVFNGLNRNIAFYEAQQNKSKIQDMVDASWITAVINSFIGIVVSLSALAYYVICGYPNLYLLSVIILFGVLIFSPFNTHYETIYRSTRSFMPLGIFLNIKNGVNVILGFLPIIFGAVGLIFRNAVLPLINFLLLYRKTPIKHQRIGNIDEVLELARVGFPMLVTGVLYIFFNAADRTIVALKLGPTAVGELALSGMVAIAIQVMPVSIGALLYPRASYIYGTSKTSTSLKKFFFSV